MLIFYFLLYLTHKKKQNKTYLQILQTSLIFIRFILQLPLN